MKSVGIIAFVLAIVASLLASELHAWLSTVATLVVRMAAHLLPPSHRARYREEWLEQVGTLGSSGRRLAALVWSLGTFIAAPRVARVVDRRHLVDVALGTAVSAFWIAMATLFLGCTAQGITRIVNGDGLLGAGYLLIGTGVVGCGCALGWWEDAEGIYDWPLPFVTLAYLALCGPVCVGLALTGIGLGLDGHGFLAPSAGVSLALGAALFLLTAFSNQSETTVILSSFGALGLGLLLAAAAAIKGPVLLWASAPRPFHAVAATVFGLLGIIVLAKLLREAAGSSAEGRRAQVV